MKRRQLFEFQDEPWFPDLVREGQIEILSLATRTSGFARAVAPALGEVVDAVGAQTVLDLCSGAGGPIVQLLESLAAKGRPLPRVLLSDLYPNTGAWTAIRRRWPDAIDFVAEPVDATRIPAELGGEVVTIINALHHFPTSVAHAVIAAAVRRRSALFVAEGFPRDLFRASALLPTLGLALLQNPFVCRRGGVAKALLSVPLPLLSITGIWDWFASTIRIHEPAELLPSARAMAPDYHWEHGAASYPPWGRAVYLIGLPPSHD